MVATRRDSGSARQDRAVPARLRTADPALVAPALDRFRSGAASKDDLRLLTKHLLALLVDRAPGGAVEVRVPPFAAVQCVPGPRHTRGTPPNVIETDPRTWLELATGRLAWPAALASGRVSASGSRADIAPLLPVVRL